MMKPGPIAAAVVAALIAAIGATPSRAGVHNVPRSERILIVYNHGSDGTDSRAQCKPFGRPLWIRSLDGTFVASRWVEVVYPCTPVAERYSEAGGWKRLSVLERADRISARVEKHVAEGYVRRNIFLAGQSAGGWASLLLKRHNPGQFNAAIVTAPAFNGQRVERLCAARDCLGPGDFSAQMRISHEAFLEPLKTSSRVFAVVFHGGKFGWPSEYGFLKFDGNNAYIFLDKNVVLRNPDMSPCGTDLIPGEHNTMGYYGTERRHICGTIPKNLRKISTFKEAGIAENEIRYGCKRLAHCPET